MLRLTYACPRTDVAHRRVSSVFEAQSKSYRTLKVITQASRVGSHAARRSECGDGVHLSNRAWTRWR